MRQIEELLVETKVDRKPNLNADYCLKIDRNQSNHVTFVQRCGTLRFPNIRKMEFLHMSSLGKTEIDDFNKFFQNSTPQSFNFIHFSSGDSPKYPKLGALFKGLCQALRNVTDEVFLDGLEFTGEEFAEVLEASSHVPRVIFCNCNIKVDSKFKLTETTRYQIEYLDLFNSFYPKDIKYLNSQGLETLVKEMAKTNLKDTLKTLHITSYKNKGKSEKGQQEQDLFKKHDFHTKVVADNNWSKPAGGVDGQEQYQEW